MYKYINPIDEGYTAANVPKRVARELLPHRPQNCFLRTTFYINETDILMHHYSTFFGKVIMSLIFPAICIVHGFNRETFSDFVHLWKEKKYGKFSSDKVFRSRNPEFYNRVASYALVKDSHTGIARNSMSIVINEEK